MNVNYSLICEEIFTLSACVCALCAAIQRLSSLLNLCSISQQIMVSDFVMSAATTTFNMCFKTQIRICGLLQFITKEMYLRAVQRRQNIFLVW